MSFSETDNGFGSDRGTPRKYTTVTLLIQKNGTAVDASSGIYIVDGKSDNYIISLFKEDYGFNEREEVRISYTSNEMINGDKVKWRNLVINDEFKYVIEKISIPEINEFFQKCKIDKSLIKENKFRYLFVYKLPSFLVIRNELTDFRILTDKYIKLPQKIKIESCPFGLTSAELFHGYTNYGYLNYKSENSDFWLSDCKFMDNMNGGVVSLGDMDEQCNQSIGLVWGNIKWPNHGELMIILNWRKLVDYLPFEIILQIQENQQDEDIIINNRLSMEKEGKVDDAKTMGNIVGLRVKNRYGFKLWGSGVIIENGMIVTNKHVITGDFNSNELPEEIEVFFSGLNGEENCTFKIEEPVYKRDIFMSLEKDDHDICFIRCRGEGIEGRAGLEVLGGGKLKEFRRQYQCHRERYCDGHRVEGITTIGKDGDKASQDGAKLRIGDTTISIGYGLFLEEREGGQVRAQPLRSVGNVTKVHGDLEQVLCSSSCWGGCSGGAVVNVHGELVALMANNARDTASGEVLPAVNLAIGVGLLSACYGEYVLPRAERARL